MSEGAPRRDDPLYKGEPLDAARGPGLGCFWAQVSVLATLLVVTPLGVVARFPPWLSAALLIVTLILLLFTGQTVIFLLRLVAADRRTRRRPLASTARRTVGDMEAGVAAAADAGDEASWTALLLPPDLQQLYARAETDARAGLERHDELGPYSHQGDGAAVTVSPARIRLPGLRRATDVIRIDIVPDGAPATTYRVAIRYESEGPHRYRYWPPVMTMIRTGGMDGPADGAHHGGT